MASHKRCEKPDPKDSLPIIAVTVTPGGQIKASLKRTTPPTSSPGKLDSNRPNKRYKMSSKHDFYKEEKANAKAAEARAKQHEDRGEFADAALMYRKAYHHRNEADNWWVAMGEVKDAGHKNYLDTLEVKAKKMEKLDKGMSKFRSGKDEERGGARTVQCPHCQKKLNGEMNLRMHLRGHRFENGAYRQQKNQTDDQDRPQEATTGGSER